MLEAAVTEPCGVANPCFLPWRAPGSPSLPGRSLNLLNQQMILPQLLSGQNTPAEPDGKARSWPRGCVGQGKEPAGARGAGRTPHAGTARHACLQITGSFDFDWTRRLGSGTLSHVSPGGTRPEGGVKLGGRDSGGLGGWACGLRMVRASWLWGFE